MKLHILKKTAEIAIGLAGVFLLLLWMVWMALPLLLSFWQPLGISCQLQGRLGWSHQQLTVPPLRLTYQGIPLLSMSAATVRYVARGTTAPHWQCTIQQLRLNLSGWQMLWLPAASISQPRATWLSQPPSWQLIIQQLILDPAEETPLSVTLSHKRGELQLHGEHPRGQLQATLDPQRRLRLAATLLLPNDQPPATLQGELQLGESLQQWPSNGQLQLQQLPSPLPEATQITLKWQGPQGEFLMTTPHAARPLLKLPWCWQQHALHCPSGHWAWPDETYPLQGGVTLQLDDAQASSDQEQLGRSRRLQSTWRLPSSPWGPLTLQLNGILNAPSVAQAILQWDYQAQGSGSAQQAPWHSEGCGTWQPAQQQLLVRQLSATCAQWTHGNYRAEQLHFTLKAPLQYAFQRLSADDSLASIWQLRAQRLWLPHHRSLRQVMLELQLKGPSLQQLTWQGVLRSDQIASITGKGEWNGKVLQGDLHWDQQTLRPLQSLLPPRQQWDLKQGTLRNTTHFTASADQGLVLVGLLALKNASVGMKEGVINGIHLHLPYRWKRQWQVGKPDQPATLQIEELQQILTLRHIVLKVQGRLPYSQRGPLHLSGQIGEILGGHLILPALRLPQRAQPSLLKLTDIDLSQLTALLSKRGVQLTGQVSGCFPLYTGHSHWLIKQGYLWNTTPLTAALDRAVVDRLRQQGVTDRVLNWVTRLQIQQARTHLQLDTLGVLTLQAALKGNSPQQPQQPVQLRYQHQENLLTLWRSCRASDLLQQQIEQEAPALRKLHP